MSVNSSFVDTSLSSNSSLPPVNCLTFRTSMAILTSFTIANIFLILPLSILILHLGYQQWRQQCHISTVAAATSHSDIFTYHMVVMEMITILGCLFYIVGVATNLPDMITKGFEIFFSPWCVKIHFHTLTCVEHYMAVVHPVTYRHLKNTGGIRIRNICIGCVWLLCLLWGSLLNLISLAFGLILHFCILAFALIVICFCCISVLCALRRPGPGEVAGDREQVDQIKQRAFNTVMTIMGVLWFGLGGILVCSAVQNSQMLSDSDGCSVIMATVWFSLPSSFVLPLLYLHRAGKLSGCKRSVN